MLQIGDQKFTQQNSFAARAAVFKALGVGAPKEGSTERSLLGTLAILAANDGAAFELVDVQKAFSNMVAESDANAKTTAAARRWCEENGNPETSRDLIAALKNQPRTLAALQAQQTVIITRGTNPVQAELILKNGTFGGHDLNAAINTPPRPGDADAQTGLGEKNAGERPLEEWSLGQQKGFALDGFMLIAEANVSLVTLPRDDYAVNVGEAGVCGFAAAGLVRVAILEKGRSSNEDPGKLNEDATKRELERLNKQISENPASAVRRLKEAASQTRGVNL